MFRVIGKLAAVLQDYQYFGIRTDTHIRLLTLLPGLPQDTIRVTLTTVDLADQNSSTFPLYECLSYAWGNTDERTPIYCDNKAITVTKNLAEALQYLRHYEIPRTLWVDALCINQGDMTERSLQVSLMSDIYSKATRVLIWLGPESHDSDIAMQTIIQLSNTYDFDLNAITFRPINDPGRWTEWRTQLPYSDAQITAIHNLLQRPWFQRLWVWQEARLGSRNTIVMAGQTSMRWWDFHVAGRFYRWKREFAFGPRFIDMERQLNIVNDINNNTTQSPMTALAFRTGHSECSEPRDRIYALRGITTDEVEIQPDYSLSLSDVYKDAVLQVLKQLHNIEFLTTCQWRENRDEIPTWVPDYRLPNDRFRFFDIDGAGELPADAFEVEPNVLQVSGVEIDVIDKVVTLPLDASDTEIFDFIRKLAPPDLANEQYITGGSLLAAYCRTYFANNFLESYRPPTEVFGYQRYLQAFALLKDDAEPDAKAKALFVQQLKLHAAGRAIAVTKQGYLLLGPDAMQAGDRVCHLPGCRWPVVLRPYHRDFQVVGYAYVDGADDKQALLGPLPDGWTNVAFWAQSTGKWWSKFYLAATNELRIEDPRLPALPEGWTIRSHEEDHLWNWYVREGSRDEDLRKTKREVRWRSDPRLTTNALAARGVKIEKFRLV